ncbi:unnamed protein product [Calicophoron daubneyi]|uniref:Peptidase M3A/M3B catalytic domain-containing protein n=1 Tax=Calicophoron daubneyi TaxID=300641 RepID=A0AAV2TA24_CALDB
MFRISSSFPQLSRCVRYVSLPRDVKFEHGPSYYIIPEVPGGKSTVAKCFPLDKWPRIEELTPPDLFNEFSRMLIDFQLSLSKLSENLRKKGVDAAGSATFIHSLEQIIYPMEHAIEITRSISTYSTDPTFALIISRLFQKLQTSWTNYFCLDPEIYRALLTTVSNRKHIDVSEAELLRELIHRCWLEGAELMLGDRGTGQVNSNSKSASKASDHRHEQTLDNLLDVKRRLEKEEIQFQAMVQACASASSPQMVRSSITGRFQNRPESSFLMGDKGFPISESDLAPSAPSWLPRVLGGRQVGGHVTDMEVNLNSDLTVRAVLRHCSTRQIRQSLWLKWVQRASVRHFGGSTGDHASNDGRMQEIRRLRHGYARLLGCEDWLSVVWKSEHMRSPSSPEWLIDNVLEPLRVHLRPVGENELRLLSEWASANLDMLGAKLQPWDIDYAIEQYNYAATFDQLHAPIAPVRGSLLAYLHQMLSELASLFNLKLTIDQKKDELVSMVRVQDDSSGEVVGEVILDLFGESNRAHLHGSAVPLPLLTRTRRGSTDKSTEVAHNGHHSVVTLLGGLPKSAQTEGLDVEVVLSIASGFGSCLQLILPRTYHCSRFGLSPYLAPDITHLADDLCYALARNLLFHSHVNPESPSKKVSSFYSDPVLKLHPPPARLVVLPTLRNLYEARFDLSLWSAEDRNQHWITLNNQHWSSHLPYARHSEDTWPCSAIELFGPNSMPGLQYQRVWRDVVVCDVLAALREKGWPAQQTSGVHDILRSFREIFLEAKDRLPPGELFRLFRGRDPNPEHLLQSMNVRGSLAYAPVSSESQLDPSLAR